MEVREKGCHSQEKESISRGILKNKLSKKQYLAKYVNFDMSHFHKILK